MNNINWKMAAKHSLKHHVQNYLKRDIEYHLPQVRVTI